MYNEVKMACKSKLTEEVRGGAGQGKNIAKDHVQGHRVREIGRSVQARICKKILNRKGSVKKLKKSVKRQITCPT